ncbi:MAG: GNAT family N-acetyltransferase [Actinomycetota bacterium]|nr:GNAT family N-acetyltransferase [Actinomycetota bacterium]
MRWTIRRAEDSDLRFLQEMLLEAANWRSGNRPTDRNDVLTDPHVARYPGRVGPGRRHRAPGAGRTRQPAGAAWFRFFSRDEPTFGFIDETIPELSIAVRGDCRGCGIGTRLLNALIGVAREKGVRALSLSVEEDYPALRLYERSGFRSVEKKDNAHTMRLDFESGPPKEHFGSDR